VIERLWMLLSHYHGQTVNYNKLAAAADLSVPTLKKYLFLLEQTYMIRLLQPAAANMKKRLIKSPKVYLRDPGILHCLLEIEGFDRLLAHPVAGASWEAFAMENILADHQRWRPSFLRTSNGAEIGLILERGERRMFFEFKLSKAPKLSRGFFELVRDMQPDRAMVIAPVDEPYEIRRGIWAMPPQALRSQTFESAG